MKKYLSIFLVLCMTLGIVACNTTGGAETTTGSGDGETTQPSNDSTTDEQTTTENTTTEQTTKEQTTAEQSTSEQTTSEETTAEQTTVQSYEETPEETETAKENWDPTVTDATYVKKYPYVDSDKVLHLSFQDTYTFDSPATEIKNQDVTSFKVGTTTYDDAVLKIKDGKIYASGCGSATVVLSSGSKVEVEVHPSPINLLFLTGQSNGSGDPPEAHCYPNGEYQQYAIRSPETMAYYTFTHQLLSIEAKVGSGNNPADFVCKNLTWERCSTNIAGIHPTVLADPVTTRSFINYSSAAGLAAEWIRQTDERVWVVNASHGGMPIHRFMPSEDGTPVDNDYYQAVAVFNLALETLYREVDAGHFTLNHMAYYWFQGESDNTNTAEYYLDAFAKVHAGFMKDVVYSHNGIEKELEYCGIMTIRSSRDNSGNSAEELYLTGPRLAQYIAANETDGVFKNVFIATKATERWTVSNDNVKNYFLEKYGSNEEFRAIFGYDIPSTLAQVHPQIHYRVFGHNEMGFDAARNSLQFLNLLYPDRSYDLSYEPSSKRPTLTLVGIDGYTELGNTIHFDTGSMSTYVIPYISPEWRTCEGLTIRVITHGFVVDGYKITCLDSSVETMKIAVYLGGEFLEYRTFDVTFGSKFSDNMPLVINVGTSAAPDYVFEGYGDGWDAGFLTFADKKFTVYDQKEENGWLYDGDSLWNGHGGFFLIVGMRIGAVAKHANEGSLGIRYVAGKSGKIKIGADVFVPNLDSCYVAIFINGNKIYPSKPYSPDVRGLGNWYTFSQSDTVEIFNKTFENIVIEVNEGDEIVFAVSRVNSTSQTILYPTITYVD